MSCSRSTKSTCGSPPAVQPSMFALYAAPAINLFEKTTDRIALKSNQHEYHVVPDRSHYLDFEPHRLLEVFAHYSGRAAKSSGKPLYSASLEGGSSGPYFTRYAGSLGAGLSRKSATAYLPTIPARTCSFR